MTNKVRVKNESILISGKKNKGMIDESTEDHTWDDLVGSLIVDAAGPSSAPTREEWKPGVYGLGYDANDVQDWGFHCRHNEVSGGDKFFHPHVRHNGTGITGDLVLEVIISYNFGHERTGSPAPITKNITIANADLVQHNTVIPDVLFMQSGGGAGFFDSDDLLPDDDFMVTVKVTTFPTITGGLSSKIFIPFCDIHREVTDGSGTTNRVPDFYAAA